MCETKLRIFPGILINVNTFCQFFHQILNSIEFLYWFYVSLNKWHFFQTWTLIVQVDCVSKLRNYSMGLIHFDLFLIWRIHSVGGKCCNSVDYFQWFIDSGDFTSHGVLMILSILWSFPFKLESKISHCFFSIKIITLKNLTAHVYMISCRLTVDIMHLN